jgi:hypothetical protein
MIIAIVLFNTILFSLLAFALDVNYGTDNKANAGY